MRHLSSLFFFVFYLCFCLRAQDYRVVSVEHLPNDMSAREDIKRDEKDRQCAVLRITTKNLSVEQRNGFYFQCDYASWVVERRVVGGELWLWVSPDLKTLKIFHNELGNYELHIAEHDVRSIESLHVYKVLIEGTFRPTQNVVVQAEPQNNGDEQYLLFNVTPTNAQLFVDDEPWPLKEGKAQKRVKLGKHHYRVEASEYISQEEEVLVEDPNYTKIVKVNLKAAFGFLKIEGESKLLSATTISIDDKNGSDAVSRPYKLNSGWHTVSFVHPHLKPWKQTITIFDEETVTLKPHVYTRTNFVTLDLAYNPISQTSYGATYGSVGAAGIGWFVTAASNFDFRALDYDFTTIHLSSGNYYTGESCSTRISAMAGIVLEIKNPVYARVGAGYGTCVKSSYTNNGQLVKNSDSYEGIDATMGVLLNLKHLSLSVNVVSTEFQVYEVKVGVGYCLRKSRFKVEGWEKTSLQSH